MKPTAKAAQGASTEQFKRNRPEQARGGRVCVCVCYVVKANKALNHVE